MKTFNLKLITVSAVALTLFSSAHADIPASGDELFSSCILVNRTEMDTNSGKLMTPGEELTPANPEHELVREAAQDQAKAVAAYENRFTKKYLLEPAQQLALSALEVAGNGGYFVAKYAASTAFWHVLGPSGINATVQLIASAATPFAGPLAPAVPLAIKIIQMANTASEYIPIVREVKYGLIGLATKDIILPGAVVATKVAAKATKIAAKYGPAAIKSTFSAGRSIYNWFTKENSKTDADVEPEVVELETLNLEYKYENEADVEPKPIADGDMELETKTITFLEEKPKSAGFFEDDLGDAVEDKKKSQQSASSAEQPDSTGSQKGKTSQNMRDHEVVDFDQSPLLSNSPLTEAKMEKEEVVKRTGIVGATKAAAKAAYSSGVTAAKSIYSVGKSVYNWFVKS